ncbi:hypothetical protein THAOC_23980, partial [Thalassiosira oceanica]
EAKFEAVEVALRLLPVGEAVIRDGGRRTPLERTTAVRRLEAGRVVEAKFEAVEVALRLLPDGEAVIRDGGRRTPLERATRPF